MVIQSSTSESSLTWFFHSTLGVRCSMFDVHLSKQFSAYEDMPRPIPRQNPDCTELWSPIIRPFVKEKHLLIQERSISSLQSKEIDQFAVRPAIKSPELTPYLVSAIFSDDKSRDLCLNSRYDETFAKRPLSKSALIYPISVSGSNFNPRNIQYIPVVKIIAFLELDQNWAFFKGLTRQEHKNLIRLRRNSP